MCLLMYRPADAPALSPEWLADFYRRNSDGFGAWWLAKDKAQRPLICVAKTMDPNKIIKIVRKVESLGVEAGYHFRMRTHGAVSKENTHPFPVFGHEHRLTTVAAHNGVLSDFTPSRKNLKFAGNAGPSDTAIFIGAALRPLINGFGIEQFFDPKSSAFALLHDYLGYSNKLILTNVNHGFSLLGDNWTEWHGYKMSNLYAWSAEKRFTYKPDDALKSWNNGASGAYEYWRGGTKHQGTYGASPGSASLADGDRQSPAQYDINYVSRPGDIWKEGYGYVTPERAREIENGGKPMGNFAGTGAAAPTDTSGGEPKGTTPTVTPSKPIPAKEPHIKMKGGSVRLNGPGKDVPIGSASWFTFWEDQRRHFKANKEQNPDDVDAYIDAEIDAGIATMEAEAAKAAKRRKEGDALERETKETEPPKDQIAKVVAKVASQIASQNKEGQKAPEASTSFHWLKLYANSQTDAIDTAKSLSEGDWAELVEAVGANPTIAGDLIYDLSALVFKHYALLRNLEDNNIRLYIKSDNSLGAVVMKPTAVIKAGSANQKPGTANQ